MITKTLIAVLFTLGAYAESNTSAKMKQEGREAKAEMKQEGREMKQDASEFKDKVVNYVSGAKVVEAHGDEYALQTPKGTKVEVELNRDGSIDEASGKAAVSGDVFTPSAIEGKEMISLEKATESLKRSGKMPTGEWQFEKSWRHGYVYEFEGKEDGKDHEYSVRATDGKIVRDSRDLM